MIYIYRITEAATKGLNCKIGLLTTLANILKSVQECVPRYSRTVSMREEKKKQSYTSLCLEANAIRKINNRVFYSKRYIFKSVTKYINYLITKT